MDIRYISGTDAEFNRELITALLINAGRGKAIIGSVYDRDLPIDRSCDLMIYTPAENTRSSIMGELSEKGLEMASPQEFIRWLGKNQGYKYPIAVMWAMNKRCFCAICREYSKRFKMSWRGVLICEEVSEQYKGFSLLVRAKPHQQRA